MLNARTARGNPNSRRVECDQVATGYAPLAKPDAIPCVFVRKRAVWRRCGLFFYYGIENYFLFTKPCGVFRYACCSTQNWVGRTTPLRGGVEAVRHGRRCILKKIQTWMFVFFLFLISYKGGEAPAARGGQ